MRPLLVWARRSVAVPLAPVLLAVLAFTAWSSEGWQYEWLWGMRNPVSTVALISPLVAAGVAFDISRRWTPVVEVLGPSARRWRRASLAVPAVHVLWAFACLCAVWATAAVRIALNDAITSPDPWLPFEALASLAAAAAVGLVVGTYVPDAAAPPIAAISVFATTAFASTLGLSELFRPLGLSSSAVGLTRDPQAAALLIGLNLAVAALCCLLALRGPRPSLPWAAGAASLLAVVIALLAAPAQEREFRPVGGPTVCAARADVRVCGPQAADPLIRELSLGLQQAVGSLTGLPFPTTYELGLAGVIPPADAGRAIVVVSPAKLKGPERNGTVADVLSQPRPCPQLFDFGPDTEPLVDRQAQVRAWILEALRAGGASAPAGITAAYDELLTCRPTSS